MNEELQPKLSYEERSRLAKERASEAIGELTPENFLAAGKDPALIDEYRDLAEWYTDAYDAALVTAYQRQASGAPDAVLQSMARQAVAASEPEKFGRFRECERSIERVSYVHQQTAGAAHATLAEQGLRYRTLDC